jgi:hypothetical protein
MNDRNKFILILSYACELLVGLMLIFFTELIIDFLVPAIIVVIFLWLVLMVISIMEVIRSGRIGRWEKVLWVIGILSVFNLAGLVYIILRRRRIIEDKTLAQA